MNIEEIDVPVEFYFDQFKPGKKYTFKIFDFLNPEEMITAVTKQGYRKEYLRWKVKAVEDYGEEGIPRDISFFQQFSKHAFSIAYVKYKLFDPKMRDYLYNHKNDIIDVRMTFERETKKKMRIHNIVTIS